MRSGKVPRPQALRPRQLDTNIGNSMTELTLEESIQQILPTLPAPVRNFFAQGKLGETARTLMDRYALHVDQGGIVERELMFALLGLRSPDEIAEALYTDLPVSRQTVIDIIADFNKEVFVPLREEMRKGENVPPLSSPTPPQPPLPPAAGPIFNPSIAPLPPKMVMPRLVVASGEVGPTRPIGTPIEKRSLINLIQKPIESSDKLLEDHEEPHIDIDISDKVQGESPLRQALRSVVPETLPGAIFYPELPKPPTPPPTPTPSTSPKASQSAAPKPYTVDPYHEPIDGK